MSKPITVPNIFAAQTGPIPLSQLDSDFSTVAAAINDYATYGSYLVDTGSVNNVIVTTPVGATFSYTVGVTFQVLVLAANTISAVTINVNGLGTQAILNSDGTVLLVDQIHAGQLCALQYDGTAFRIISQGGSSPTLNKITVGVPVSGAAITINSISGGTAVNAGDGTIFWEINTNSSSLQIGTSSNNTVILYSNNLSRLTIYANGGVTIGAPTGASKGAGTLNVASGLYVNGTAVTVP